MVAYKPMERTAMHWIVWDMFDVVYASFSKFDAEQAAIQYSLNVGVCQLDIAGRG
jgi:hypothetical protein